MLTIKYPGADGLVLWQRHYDGPVNGDDDVIAAGSSAASGSWITGFATRSSPPAQFS
jgi:hypothetical protein